MGPTTAATYVEPDAAEVWRVDGAAGSLFGWAVSELDDVDGDGVTDVIVGAPIRDGYTGGTTALSGATGAVIHD
ncbi:MAG: hypothetical protein ABMB14_20105, partial [Myxococcota bacterium]